MDILFWSLDNSSLSLDKSVNEVGIWSDLPLLVLRAKYVYFYFYETSL